MMFDKKISMALALLITEATALGRKSEKNTEPNAPSKHHKIEGKRVTNLFKRAGTCDIPSRGGIVAVQKSGKNAGWAMHNDQECTYGSWCPYACPPGQVMNQWDPSVTSYSYPGSQNGGLWCNEDGELESKRSGGYCVNGTGSFIARNKASSNVAICQTVLPGNEEMLIPTDVDGGSEATLAVPDTSYWASTASHFYINAPGVSVDDGCKWGAKEDPVGNWSPYVAGANQDANGLTFVKIGWNPVYTEDASPNKNTKPSFGVRITCADGDCNGLPCEIDPSKTDINGISEGSGTSGAGGGDFCVVTASKGKKAYLEVFSTGGSNSKREEEHQHHAHNKVVTHTTLVTVSQDSATQA